MRRGSSTYERNYGYSVRSIGRPPVVVFNIGKVAQRVGSKASDVQRETRRGESERWC